MGAPRVASRPDCHAGTSAKLSSRQAGSGPLLAAQPLAEAGQGCPADFATRSQSLSSTDTEAGLLVEQVQAFDVDQKTDLLVGGD
jgi:hypothetical protein